jgi:putative nonproteinogenic amino acid hydroxylase
VSVATWSAEPALRSRRLGAVEVERPGMAADLAAIDALPKRSSYSEYSFGGWHSHVLANPTGDEHDDEFRPHDGAALPTSLGRRLGTIMELVEDTFVPDALRWVRVFTLTDGLLLPHVDFIEFDGHSTRLQVPLRTTPGALHSEGEWVVHLRAGEVWWLEARVPHAACSPGGSARIALSLDFAVAPEHIARCLRRPAELAGEPELIERPPLGDEELEALLALAATFDAASVRELLRTYALVHFRRRVHAAACYDWLVEAARRAGAAALAERAAAFRTYCLHKRDYGERFRW